METDALPIGIVMQRRPLNNRWQPYQWRPLEVMVAPVAPSPAPRCLFDDDKDTRWLFAGFEVRLYRDESEGYFLNTSSPVPCWFVMFRLEDVDGQELAVPKAVTLSYNEAARLMDGGETVETIPASSEIIERMNAFVAEHYRPEPKKKRRKPSFEGGAAVDEMAKAERGQNGS